MNLRELLGELSPGGVEKAQSKPLEQALHDEEGSDAPMMVRLFTAGGTWLGASLAAFLFAALELYEILPLALLLGVGLFAGATVMARNRARSLARTQLIWAMSLGAHGLIAGAFAEANVGETAIALTWTLLNVVTMMLIRVPSFQIASAVAAVAFGNWFVAELDLPLYSLWLALPVSVLAASAWIHESSWVRRLGSTWAAIAYGLPVGAAIPLTVVAIDSDAENLVATGPGGPIASLIVLALVAWVLLRAREELEGKGEKVPQRAYSMGLIAVFTALIARNVPGLTLSLLWMLVAHLRRSRPLQGIAMTQLAAFLFFFYYQLSTTLLLKSLWVIGTGAVVLWGAYLARPGADRPGVEVVERRPRWASALALCLLGVGIVSSSVISKERVLANGQSVLLPLGPRDPRSLIQGDYMVLNYRLDEEMREQSLDLERIERHGELVVKLDADRVGHFARLDDGGQLASDELRLEYRVRDGWQGRLRVGAESFFFEEGSAHVYEDARFGELVVDEDGGVVLVGLRDEAKRPLGIRLHE
jgi:uncharacterized membrane-anchored protein